MLSMKAEHQSIQLVSWPVMSFPELTVEKRPSPLPFLQDPLAGVVKIVPNLSVWVNTSTMSIRKKLTESLDFVVDTVVSQVGVDHARLVPLS